MTKTIETKVENPIDLVEDVIILNMAIHEFRKERNDSLNCPAAEYYLYYAKLLESRYRLGICFNRKVRRNSRRAETL